MSNLDAIRAAQQERAKEWEQDLKTAQQEQEEFMESEEAKRRAHEHVEDLWEAKAKKEGWNYKRNPFVSALDRQRAYDEKKQEEIAYLKERIKALGGDI